MQNDELKKQVTIIILATNEELILQETVNTILEENKIFIEKIFIITPENVTQGCLKVIKRLEDNNKNILFHKFQPNTFPGYGGASIYGISLVDTNYFVLADADGETDPKEIKNLINYIDNSDYDIVSCSRWLAKNWLNQYGLLNYIFNWIF